jgi:hypothetical protein
MLGALPVVAGSAVAAETELPDSIGPAKLGMTWDAARAVIPSVASQPTPPEGHAPTSLAYSEAKLFEQQFGDLQLCQATLRFFQKRLISFNCTCPDKKATEAYLLKQYGEPAARNPQGWEWLGETRSMVYEPASGRITVLDNEASRNMQDALQAVFRAAQAMATPPAGTPGGTPSR